MNACSIRDIGRFGKTVLFLFSAPITQFMRQIWGVHRIHAWRSRVDSVEKEPLFWGVHRISGSQSCNDENGTSAYPTDHHDLTTTTKYASHRDNNMISKVRAANVGLGMKPIVDVTSVDTIAGHEDMSVTKRYEVPSRHL